jgi:hypothetical protein
MIYNRTYIDIINARKIYYNKVQKSIELSAEDQTTIDRAFFNLTAINRITAKITDLWQAIVDFGGEKTESEDVREWGEQEFFKLSNFSNIRQNVADMINELNILPFANVEIYQNMYSVLNDEYLYTNLNNLEKLLYDIGLILDTFAVKVGKSLYILGAYNATLSEGVLVIE